LIVKRSTVHFEGGATMSERSKANRSVFVAGATGAIGLRLVPQLVSAGHEVVATTRSETKFELLRALGAEAVALDGLDAAAVGQAVARAEPDVIVHQMTSLSTMGFNLRKFDRSFAVTNELRTVGTDHLLAAATASGVPRFLAQSYTGWPNTRLAGRVTTERDPLTTTPPTAQRRTLDAIIYLERAVTRAPLDGLVLRYGSLYGPGASEKFADMVRARKFPLVGAGTGVWSFTHVDDAASATVAAVERGGTGIYNVVDDEPAEVGVWLPYLARVLGAPPPRHVPAWLARLAAGDVVVSMMTDIRGSANDAAKRDLRWRPRWASWRDGFRDGLDPDGDPIARTKAGKEAEAGRSSESS